MHESPQGQPDPGFTRLRSMLFHDAVFMAVEGMGAKLVPVGPPNRYEEVVIARGELADHYFARLSPGNGAA